MRTKRIQRFASSLGESLTLRLGLWYCTIALVVHLDAMRSEARHEQPGILCFRVPLGGGIPIAVFALMSL